MGGRDQWQNFRKPQFHSRNYILSSTKGNELAVEINEKVDSVLADVFNMQSKETGIEYSVPRIVEEVNFEMRTYNDYYRSKS